MGKIGEGWNYYADGWAAHQNDQIEMVALFIVARHFKSSLSLIIVSLAYNFNLIQKRLLRFNHNLSSDFCQLKILAHRIIILAFNEYHSGDLHPGSEDRFSIRFNGFVFPGQSAFLS